MKTIEFSIDEELDEVEIIPLADIHIGDELCDITLLKNTIEYIKDTKNAFCIINGDIVNNAIKTSKSDTYGEQMSPHAQIAQAIQYLAPIKDKIISITTGNHEERTNRQDGIDLSLYVADMLGIADRYSSTSCFVFLSMRDAPNHSRCFGIYHTHGTGDGKRVGSKANAVDDMSQIVDADIYIHSHTHQPLAFKQDYLRANYKQHKVAQVTKLFVNTNAFLRFGGYAERKKYRPSSRDIPKIILKRPTGHSPKEMRVLL